MVFIDGPDGKGLKGHSCVLYKICCAKIDLKLFDKTFLVRIQFHIECISFIGRTCDNPTQYHLQSFDIFPRLGQQCIIFRLQGPKLLR